MRAVNLLPADLRSAASSGSSGSPVGSYAVLGALALLVVIAATWAVSARQVDDKRAEVARLDAEAQAAEAQVQNLAGFEETLSVANARKKVVSDLAKGRVDWADTLREISRTVPKTAWITQMAATTAPGVSVEGPGNPLRGTVPSPAVEILGCSPNQDDVARLMTRLRAMDGVEKVGLASSEKSDTSSTTGAAPASGDSSSEDCRQGTSTIPQFNMVIFLRNPAGAPAATTTAAAATGAAATPQAGAK
jgi:Tfp pilus assembly protein PilN